MAAGRALFKHLTGPVRFFHKRAPRPGGAPPPKEGHHMTASIQPEPKSPSRRALLAGALGGIGALAATVIGRASPVRGADGEPVVVGGEYEAFSPTGLTRSEGTTLYGHSGSGMGVYGTSTSNIGVRGNSGSGVGVYGSSTSENGVYGFSTSSMASGASAPRASASTAKVSQAPARRSSARRSATAPGFWAPAVARCPPPSPRPGCSAMPTRTTPPARCMA